MLPPNARLSEKRCGMLLLSISGFEICWKNCSMKKSCCQVFYVIHIYTDFSLFVDAYCQFVYSIFRNQKRYASGMFTYEKCYCCLQKYKSTDQASLFPIYCNYIKCCSIIGRYLFLLRIFFVFLLRYSRHGPKPFIHPASGWDTARSRI